MRNGCTNRHWCVASRFWVKTMFKQLMFTWRLDVSTWSGIRETKHLHTLNRPTLSTKSTSKNAISYNRILLPWWLMLPYRSLTSWKTKTDWTIRTSTSRSLTAFTKRYTVTPKIIRSSPSGWNYKSLTIKVTKLETWKKIRWLIWLMSYSRPCSRGRFRMLRREIRCPGSYCRSRLRKMCSKRIPICTMGMRMLKNWKKKWRRSRLGA